MKKLFVNCFCFPVLFVYYVAKIMAGSIGVKNNQLVPVAITVLILLGAGYGIWQLAKPEDPFANLPPDPKGIFFAPGQGTNSVISITMLESALYEFDRRYQRAPTNFADLKNSGIIPGFPAPKEGHKYQLDIQWPVIREVPQDTPDPPPLVLSGKTESQP